MATAKGIQGYNVKLKKKEALKNPVINVSNGRFFAKGSGSDGTTISVVMSADNAKAAIKDKIAKKGEGW